MINRYLSGMHVPPVAGYSALDYEDTSFPIPGETSPW